MKLNWGHKIAAIYLLFMGAMITLLFISKRYSHELVTEDYYEKELAYQNRIDASENLLRADFLVEVGRSQGGVLVNFQNLPEGIEPKGKVMLYKPDNASFDEEIPLTLDANGTMIIHPKGTSGRYKVSIAFEVDGMDYFTEKHILL